MELNLIQFFSALIFVIVFAKNSFLKSEKKKEKYSEQILRFKNNVKRTKPNMDQIKKKKYIYVYAYIRSLNLKLLDRNQLEAAALNSTTFSEYGRSLEEKRQNFHIHF